MLEKLTPWEPQTRVSSCVEIDDLSISFERTIRVPDNGSLNALPASLGKFPLFKTEDFGDKLPAGMAGKDDIFIPMYQHEGMCISFASENRYAIKIFAGNVNAISGEPRVPDAASSHRRPGLPSRKKSIQDYVVTPPQPRIDGVVTESREVRQFVAVGSDHSVEAQMTGGRRTACLQFEVTRLESHEVEEQSINITVNTFAFKDKPIEMNISNHAFIKDIQQKIQDIEGHPADKQRLIYRGMGLEDGLLLSDYGIQEGSILHLAFKLPCAHQLRGLKCPCLPSKCQTAPKVETGQHEMALPLGGVIRQSIVEIPKRLFQESTAISFNVQILYEEPSRVSGGFPGFQSVAQIDGTPEKAFENLSIIDVETSEPVVDYNGGKGELGNVSGHGRVEKP